MYSNYKIANEEQQLALNSTYKQQQLMYQDWLINKTIPKFFIHKVYQPDTVFPPVSVYVGVSFNRYYDFDEKEKLDIHSIIAHCYETRHTFRQFVDSNLQVYEPIRVINGFHQTIIEGLLVTHFNISIAGHVMHVNMDRHFDKNFVHNITAMLTM